MVLQHTPVWLLVVFFLLLQCAVGSCSCPQHCYCTRRTAFCTSPSFPLVLPTGILKLMINGTIKDLPSNSIVLPKGENLTSLTLQSVSVGDIKPDAFFGHQLKQMIFRKVTIGRIWKNAFANCSAGTVYFRENTIEVISQGAFSGFSSEHFHMFLTNITMIESGAFKSLTLKDALTFSLCRLNEIREAAFNVTFPLIMSMNWFDHFEVDPSSFVIFNYNRLNCTCELSWLWSPKYDYREDLSYNKCISPPSLKNVYLDEINPSTLCGQHTERSID